MSVMIVININRLSEFNSSLTATLEACLIRLWFVFVCVSISKIFVEKKNCLKPKESEMNKTNEFKGINLSHRSLSFLVLQERSLSERLTGIYYLIEIVFVSLM